MTFTFQRHDDLITQVGVILALGSTITCDNTKFDMPVYGRPWRENSSSFETVYFFLSSRDDRLNNRLFESVSGIH